MSILNTHYYKVYSFLQTPLKYLSESWWQVKIAVGLILFCVFFLSFFVPYNITAWLTSFTFLPISSLSCLCIGGGVTFVLSHTVFYMISRNISSIRVYHLLLLCILDIILLSLVLAYLFCSHPDSYLTDFYETIQLVTPVVLLAYLLLGLVLAVCQLREPVKVPVSTKKEVMPDEMACFYDMNGELRFRWLLAEVLYIEAADNYVSVYYMKDGRPVKELIRNTLKNTEKNLAGKNFQKCHRSFLVNIHAVTGWKKCGRNYLLLFGIDGMSVPVSRLYIPQFIKDKPFVPKTACSPHKNADEA